MALNITLPKEYGFVLLSAATTTLLGSWLAFRIPPFRTAARIKLPQHYAEQSQLDSASDPAHKQALYLYNCAQRAHGNFVEHQPSVVVAMLIAGLRFPLVSAGLGAAWSASRVLYSVGYTDAKQTGGKGRYRGIVFIPLQSVLFLMAMWVGGEFALR
ncbi:MAG: hypothetical protein M1821_001653 [Bathelium mastoideum]|nr:MAG: hypothetical protein M1821_001653 [Bathelium mastoideum]KAI9691541.1 MAG: hypothetical protein M1822_007612 [Bathelium mastoideum]